MPQAPTATRPVVAAFDVDGTLTTRDCVTPFLRQVAGRRLAATLARHPVAVTHALAARDRDKLKALACSALRGLDAAALARSGEAFARTVHGAWLRADTVARLERHRELGHAVLLASASLEPYLAPLGALLQADGVVCTRLETAADGRLTGRLDGANCRGAEKARRVQEWLRESGRESAVLWAYGDSSGDAELLAIADHAQWVGRAAVPREPTLA